MAVLGVTEIGWRGPESYPPIISEFIKCARFMVIQKAAHMAGLPDKDEPFAGRRKMDLDDDSGYESNGNASPSPLSRPAFRRQEIPSSPFGSEPASPTRFRWAATSLHGGSRPEDASSPIVGARIQSQVRHDKKSCLHYVNTMMDEFMVRGSKSPMQWMLDLRTYGMKIHYNTTTSGHVEWCNGDELLYKNVQFNMAQFRGMVHGLMAQTKEIMVEELLFGGGGREGEIPDVPWNTIRDDPTNTTPGWSFLDDERTRLPVDGKSWLFERIGQHSDIRQRFERPGTATGLNGVEVEKYMASVARFREKLLCCMHILGGQPGRATEVLSIRHSNTWKGGHRNIFIEDGLVAFVTRYHKGFALSGDVKLIHRYLPREIGTLLVWYLWLVRPFERRLQAIVGDQYMKGLKEDQKSESKVARLFCRDGNGRQWTPDRMRQALERVTSKGLGHGLHILAYRHIAIGISRRYMRGGTAFSKDEDGKGGNDGEDEIEDLQAAHGSYMAGLVYARGMFEMHGAVASRRQQFRESSIDWHRFFAMQSAMEMTVGQKRKRDWFDEEAKEGQYERWARLKEMNMRVQFARMMNLEEKEGEFRGVQKQAIEAIQERVSQVVAVMPTGTGKSILFMLPAWVQRGGTTVVIVPLTVLRHDMQQRCARLGISCAEWEGSLTPPDGASIVLMTPEAALDDGEGSSFINRLKVTRRLDRIVIDECHVILNMDAKFRPRLRELGDLARAETQMVLLTATLPPSKEGLLWERMSWSAEQVTMFRMDTTRKNIRYSVVDPGRRIKRDEHDGFIADMVSKTSGKGVVYCKAKRRVKDIVEAKLFDCDAFHGDMTKKQRAQVLEAFRTGKTQVVVATNALGMGVDLPDIDWVIHADEPRDLLDYAQESGRGGRDGRPTQAILVTRYDQKVNSMVQSYIDGEGGCRRKIPAAYLDGNNERGQCKMDEEACDLCRPDEDSAELIEDIEEQIVGGHEEQIVGGHEEQIVGGHEEQIVGGHEEQEVGGHEEQAFRDRGRQRESEERREATRQIEEQFITQERQATAVRMRRDRERMIEAGVAERLEKQLWAWKGKCIVCRAAGTWCDHVITNTRFHDRSDARNEVLQRRNRVRFLDFSACVKCAAPQSMCNRYRDNGKGGWEKYQEDCQWYGIMGSTVFALRHAYEDIWEAWKQRLAAMEVDVRSDRAVEEYLGKRKDIGGLQGSNMAFEFLWITEQIEATDR
jgi:superfamily II DNA helicase RecQ